jgi:hypothetical protein
LSRFSDDAFIWKGWKGFLFHCIIFIIQDWFDDDVVVDDDDVSDGAIEVPGDDDGVSVPIVVVLFAASSVVVCNRFRNSTYCRFSCVDKIQFWWRIIRITYCCLLFWCQIVHDFLSNRKKFLNAAIISLIESMRNDPEKYSALVYHNNNNQNWNPRIYLRGIRNNINKDNWKTASEYYNANNFVSLENRQQEYKRCLEIQMKT